MIYVLKGRDEHLAIGRYGPYAFGQNRPSHINPVMDRTRDFVFFRVARHLELGHQRKDRLRRNHRIQPFRQPFLGRRVEAVLINITDFQPPVLKHHGDRFMPQVPKGGRVARDAFADFILTRPGGALWTEATATFTNPEAQPVTAAVIVMMAGTTADVAIARENFIVK